MNEEDYLALIQPYIDAQQNLLTRLEALNKDYRRKYENYPIHNIQARIKEKESIEAKLERLHLPVDAESARENLRDVAGIRVICYFVEDIYDTISKIARQSDLITVLEKDYIREPKPNGYRSYHIVLGVPVYYSDGMEYFPVEIQFRTMSMDFWASMEHRICYKKEPEDRKKLAFDLSLYAELLKKIELHFEKHYDRKV